MGKFEELLQVYRTDPLICKVEEAYNKWKHHNNHKKIVNKQKNIYFLDLNDKFNKFPNILLECLLEIDFKSKECFKLYQVIYKQIQRNGNPYMVCKKTYLLKHAKINRMTLHRIIAELEEKNMLLVDKKDSDFLFILNVAPMTWNVSEREKRGIEKEIMREVERIDKKWIEEDIFSR